MDDLNKAINRARGMAEEINTMHEEALNAADINAKRRAKSQSAMIDTAQHTAEINDSVQAINGRVDTISAGLDEERKVREESEKDNMRYIRKMDKINLAVAIAGAVFGIIGTVVALIALFL